MGGPWSERHPLLSGWSSPRLSCAAPLSDDRRRCVEGWIWIGKICIVLKAIITKLGNISKRVLHTVDYAYVTM